MKNRIKYMFGYVLAILCISAYGQTTTENHVVSKTYKVESQTSLSTNDPHKVSTSIQYIDGLGRPKQSVIVKGGAGNYANNVIPYDWSAGTPTNSGFYNLNSDSSENQIVNGTTPFGDTDLLWECINTDAATSSTNNHAVAPDGGWNTDSFAIDHTKAYRYTVWVKKTGNLTDGNTYHGVGHSDVNHLSGALSTNPYFFYFDLPQIDTWYLLVGYVHASDYTGGDLGISGAYDTNGNKVMDGLEFKWVSGLTDTFFRNYLFYANDTSVRQYLWSPVVQEINGEEDSLTEIINSSTVYNNEEFFAKDIVTHMEYDGSGRMAKEYLPYASGNTDGRFEANAKDDTHHYYTNRYADDFSSVTNPLNANVFSEKIFDNSSLNRIIEQTAPGQDWDQGTGTIAGKQYSDGHTIRMEYDTNSANEVKVFTVSTTFANNVYTPSLQGGSNYYSVGELTKNVTKDENWVSSDGNNHTTEEFKNKSGQVILKRTYASVGSPSVVEKHDTYYVYDDFGNLTYVLPPKMDADTESLSSLDSKMDALGYQYVYDYRNRLVEKKIPGKGWEYIIYDQLDRPVMTQDANQRQQDEWLFTRYDQIGRAIYTGIFTHPSPVSRGALQNQFNNQNDVPSELYEIRLSSLGPKGIYYSSSDYPSYALEILTVNYYDTYVDLPSGFTAPTSIYNQTVTTNTQGLATVSKTRVLGTSNWITSITYYDEKARPIYVYTENDYLNTIDIVESKLDFIGKVLETTTTHSKTGATSNLVTIDRFEYDHMDRLISQSQKIADQVSERIVKNNYDDLGQLESKIVGNAAAKGYTLVTSGVSIADDLITKTSTSNSWNVGLVSIGTIQSDGYVEFSTDTYGKFFVVGLATSDSSTSYIPMEHAIYVHASSVLIFESGSNKGAMSTSYQIGDVFRIERIGDKVLYSHNGEVKYVSDNSSTGTVVADVSMFHTGAKIKNLHLVDNSKGLQNVDYTYNVRGWLKNINEDTQSDNDLFNFTLRYNDPTTGTPLFNGNISQTSWSTASANTTGNPVSNLYTYSYDALNRIISATDNTGNYNLSAISYDKNGNILTLQRQGHTNSSATTFGVMDDLYYTYLTNSNQLSIVRDNAPLDQFGFKDDALNQGSDTLADYAYDVNGNMTSDTNKGISSINYNHLNLPTSVSFASQYASINYVYDAAGNKQKKTVSGAGISTITTEYAGNYIYENNVLQFFNNAEGYVKANTGSSSRVDMEYVYQYKDHLGNVRLSYSDANNNGIVEIAANTAGNYTEIVEESNYYPFGLKHRGYNNVISSNGNSTAQKFGFQEQELVDDLGLNWSSFKFRNHDPAIARFMTIDPLTEVYVHWSPYVFSGNRVIDARELEGLEPASVHRTIDDAAKNFGIFYNGLSIRNNIEYGATIYQVATSSGIQYAYSVPSPGGPAGVSVSPAPAGTTAVADIHSHAAYDPRYDNNVFSGIPRSGPNTSSTTGDIGDNNSNGLIGYVTTPNGSLQRYNPSTGVITVLPVTLPFDVRDPTSPPPRPTVTPLSPSTSPITPVSPRPSVTPLPSVTPRPVTPVSPTIQPGTIVPVSPTPTPPKPLPIIINPPKCLDC